MKIIIVLEGFDLLLGLGRGGVNLLQLPKSNEKVTNEKYLWVGRSEFNPPHPSSLKVWGVGKVHFLSLVYSCDNRRAKKGSQEFFKYKKIFFSKKVKQNFFV